MWYSSRGGGRVGACFSKRARRVYLIAFDVPSESHLPSDHSADRGAHAHRNVHIGCHLQYVGQGGSGGVRATKENLARN
jgi:hypothetical protein